ncbi:flagellar brake protein [Massilia yuzhufengensis]|uniref:C-di-GMP-binding flagellar brake protein YcgR, contains PilZNR and PilZ domains n=1 Tax=Massilia yuzhufengensis TaxID=1164594 RepID=A0A1I1SF90_9BURK|nr:PilZ domain-containing protein [Massilia yuzhufengensis]SFD45137.1 c-di-GMP-binding flagellar brake protein YcgR, contains PilZNR and PilZ domains [Massilia yuzhufengensis]
MNTPAKPVIRKGPPKSSDALNRIGGNAEPHEMRDPFDIGEALSALSLSGDPVTVFPAGWIEPLLARIESVDPELPHFVIDFSGAERPPAGKAILVASLGGNAKLQFELDQSWKPVPANALHVAAEFPASCLVLNRRAARRVETPVGVNYTASFRIKGTQFDLPLYDFSQGGVGLRATPEQCFGLHVGKKLEGVRLELGPNLVLMADLEVRLLRPFRTFLLGEQVQIGCSFAAISMQMQQTLERFVTSGAVERRVAAR